MGWTPADRAMDPTAVVRALEALMSPLQWGSQDAWLTESLKRVRHAFGQPESSAARPVDELEQLLGVESDEPGWLHAALDSCAALPPFAAPSEDCLPLLSMRCALASGLATLHMMHEWRTTLGRVCDHLDGGLAIFRHDGVREVARNAR